MTCQYPKQYYRVERLEGDIFEVLPALDCQKSTSAIPVILYCQRNLKPQPRHSFSFRLTEFIKRIWDGRPKRKTN